MIGIENKPWAADQHLQLLHYAEFMKRRADGRSGEIQWKLVYLSNREPGWDSTGGRDFNKYRNGHYEHCTFTDLERWLQESAARCNALPVRVFVEELAKYVKQHLNGELGMTVEKEVKESVLADSESVRSAAAIYSAWPEIRRELMEKFMRQMEEEAQVVDKPKPIFIKWDDGLVQGKANHGFDVIFRDNQVNKLRFEFDSARHKEFYWGIAGREQDSDAKRSERINPLVA